MRVFGANSSGQKTCMHVHGVFPYFYIPYDKKDFESLERGILQMAIHLDKAINISLGQGSSNAQHVFKIQLVKGMWVFCAHKIESDQVILPITDLFMATTAWSISFSRFTCSTHALCDEPPTFYKAGPFSARISAPTSPTFRISCSL